MADTPDFGKFVPGFDFMQNLVKNAGSALPGIGQWVAPTLNPEEIEKRIGELRTIQFWLEQNARMLAATIQALEVQRMTLSTLKTMNVRMSDLRESLTARMSGAEGGSTAAAGDGRPAEPARDAAAATSGTNGEPSIAGGNGAAARDAGSASDTGAGGEAPRSAIDPMQWWSALTGQFAQLANTALQEGAAGAAGDMMQRSIEAAGETFKRFTPDTPATAALEAAPARKAPAKKRAAAKKRSPAKRAA
ncbi:PhaM family polyhydroxyalkanoate granule multifunctional regulatory protein [Piscinibacter koreensis]|uniref:Uncharacterized protein n=1 Tax=Piscinibacter koreensis TaxID=2742824 RepID=A0A7Y6NJ83_9BURK|nr:PhaM family polyhydroxyalkanoate granule multifunctional regulatory protein [Schlegelella koreensis]NUZ04195.1 hypothetical protein [Schlegelella koreensis]